MANPNSKIHFVYFGTSEFSVNVLEALKKKSLIPTLVVTKPDSPQGRGLKIKPPPAKIWAGVHNIPVIQPATLKDQAVLEKLRSENADVFIVAAYGMLIPENIFNLPSGKTLNLHPSLLPKLRGPSPIQNTILLGEEPGITVMQISEGMDEGPIVDQEKVKVPEKPPREKPLEELLAKHGGEMLARILPDWIEGNIEPVPQDDSQATYCKKIEKPDGLIDLADDPEKNLRKVRALADKPGTYLIFKRKDGKEVRIKIKDAEIIDGEFTPTQVIPEGKKEMEWEDFLRGNG